MKQNKVLSLVLALCLVFALSVTAFAADFSDVSASHWAYDEVSDVVSRGIFIGTSATTFEPEADMTRAMFVTVLSRLAGVEADDNATTPYTDVATGVYYTGAVAWASQNNLLQGVFDGTRLNPVQGLTREQMAVLISKYAAYMGVTLPEKEEAKEFTDAAAISESAKDAVAACQKAGLLTGMVNGEFQPQGVVSRAQVATVISRLAKFDNAIVYTVTFNANGGSEVAAQKVKGGAVATAPATPTKDGVTFGGWYTDSALTTAYNFTAPVQANITLYAKWNEAGTSSGGSGGGGSSSGTKVENTTDVITATEKGSDTQRTDVAISVREKGSKAKTYNITLSSALKGGVISPKVAVPYTDLAPAFDADGQAQEVEGFTDKFTAFAINFAETLKDVADDATLKVVQTNAALEMFADDPRIAQDGKKWVKNGSKNENAATIQASALKADSGSFVALEGEDITIQVYEVKDGKQTLVATYNINNDLKFDANAWSTEGAVAAATYVEGLESDFVAGTKNDVPTLEISVSGQANIFAPLDNATAKADFESVLTANGAPSPEAGKGKFTVIGLDLASILENVPGIDEVTGDLTIKQENPALAIFGDLFPDSVKEKDYAKDVVMGTEPFTMAVNGKDATLTIMAGEKTLLVVKVDSKGVSFEAGLEALIKMEDFGPRGETWPGAYNVGWSYTADFNRDWITGLEVGLKDQDGKLIVRYTADAEQIKWQKENSYIPENGGQSSAPFYQEYQGEPLSEGRGDDWTAIKGAAFDEWQQASCYLKVTTKDYGAITLTNTLGD